MLMTGTEGNTGSRFAAEVFFPRIRGTHQGCQPRLWGISGEIRLPGCPLRGNLSRFAQ
jgi:hypothetical protein